MHDFACVGRALCYPGTKGEPAMADPDGFEENPQSALDDEESDVVDESIWGPQKVLTSEEQAAYDAWFRRKVQASLDYAKRPDAVFYTHEEVMQHVADLLDKLDREAGIE
jgi:hypothetical protein